ncbi:MULTISPECIES: hypothetical protein [Providencia]|uniref:hypothetical protein n=1 Tax=Providencia TaxID=586 RepID=UPI00197E5BF7|nr:MULTISPECIES: hypothetical protein [Providencia]HEC8327200.1 hypothetical protein [Providencia rettgeri]MBN4866765.1 hypothetical protein [Providencia stuartii]MBN4875963.1 hypothetical protein [Providencia stuartii]MBN4880779.1 hypothetical protein [Providencia stuartii]MBN4885163.1 hypothetical protein [Providencia stuartii]
MHKIILPLFIVMIGSQNAFAEEQNESVDAVAPETAELSIEQKNIIDLMQNNLKFESEKLNIENQITLAKLKKELKEVNELLNEPMVQERTIVNEPENEAYEQKINELMDAPIKPAERPKVIMISHIAGVKKIGVINPENKQVTFTTENTPFKMNGTRYRVVLKNQQYRVIE